MSAKTPLHVSPSRHALSAYLYHCIAASFAEHPTTLIWLDKPPTPEHKQGETKA
jgi:hypothetical protein